MFQNCCSWRGRYVWQGQVEMKMSQEKKFLWKLSPVIISTMLPPHFAASLNSSWNGTFRSVHFLLSFWRIITWGACVVPGLASSWGRLPDNKSLYWKRGSCRSQLPLPGPRNDPRPGLLNHWANSLLPLGIPLGSFWETNRLRNLSLMRLKDSCVCVCVCVSFSIMSNSLRPHGL